VLNKSSYQRVLRPKNVMLTEHRCLCHDQEALRVVGIVVGAVHSLAVGDMTMGMALGAGAEVIARPTLIRALIKAMEVAAMGASLHCALGLL
jgi:hypothetical protein